MDYFIENILWSRFAEFISVDFGKNIHRVTSWGKGRLCWHDIGAWGLLRDNAKDL